MPSWLQIVLAIVTSGTLSSFATVWASRKKNSADAGATNVKSILEIDERLNERLVRLEERVGVLEAENLRLKQVELTQSHEIQVLTKENQKLKTENAALIQENELLKETNYDLNMLLRSNDEKRE